jgi:hypothetical protein
MAKADWREKTECTAAYTLNPSTEIQRKTPTLEDIFIATDTDKFGDTDER